MPLSGYRNRGDVVATVRISEQGMVTMKMLHDKYPDTSVITTKTGNSKTLGSSSQQFSAKGHIVRFDEYPGSNSKSYCRLEGVFEWE